MKYALIGAAVTGAMLAGGYTGSWLRTELGTAGSFSVWLVLAALAYVVVKAAQTAKGKGSGRS